MKLVKDVIGILPLGVMPLYGSLELGGSLEIELENPGGEEVQEYAFILSLIIQRNRWKLDNNMFRTEYSKMYWSIRWKRNCNV